MELRDLFLDRYLYRDNNQDLGTKESSFISADSSEIEPVPIPSGGAAQDINISNVKIDGVVIEPGTIPPSTLDVSNWGWGQTCAFTSTDLNTVSWGAGTFTSANGLSYVIGAGNTENMAAKTYIYLDLNISSTAYQTTTVSATSVGVKKVLIAVAENAAVSATFMLSEANQIVGDNILANTIDAGRMNVGILSAISADIGDITAGTITGVVITGGTLQTDTSGERVVITGNDAYFYDATYLDGTIKGNVASIYFPRTDDDTQRFVMQKRVGKNDDDENVMEMFFDKDANGGERNYMFLGAPGNTTGYGDTHTDIVQVRANDGFAIVMTNADSDKDDRVQFIVEGDNWPSSTVNAGGTKITLAHSSCNTPASVLSGGSAIIFGVNQNDGTFGTYGWFDKDAFSLNHPLKPYADNTTDIGDATHRFADVYLNRLNNNDAVVKVTTGIQIEDNAGTPVVYGYLDTNSAYLSLRSYNNRNIRFNAGTGDIFCSSDITPLTNSLADCGTSNFGWDNVYIGYDTTSGHTGYLDNNAGTLRWNGNNVAIGNPIPSGGTTYYTLRNDGSGSASWTRALYVGYSGVYFDCSNSAGPIIVGDASVDLVPYSDGGQYLGSSTHGWGRVYIGNGGEYLYETSGQITSSVAFRAPKIKLVPTSTNPSAAGEIISYSSGGTEQFRGCPGSLTSVYSFDMTAE